ncbi:hypothetical protein ACQUSY_07035 [Microbacterium sp. YY-03]|uniref:hypothetical protein n=1 Tax=Microbacterium sp. YY-03 TaxID=3421636 RepID=UPI003D16D14D
MTVAVQAPREVRGGEQDHPGELAGVPEHQEPEERKQQRSAAIENREAETERKEIGDC